MKIRRSKPITNFTIIPNEALRDGRLSFAARGVLVELLSRPQDWEATADSMSERATRQHGEKVGEGRRAIRSAFAELEAAGYLIRSKVKGEKGRFRTELELFDVPQHRGTGRGPSDSRTPDSGTSSVSTDLRSTGDQDAGDEHSDRLAGARLARQAGAKMTALEAELQCWYDAADKLDDERLRRHLLAFERRRPTIYRGCRQRALTQIGDQKGGTALLNNRQGAREVDLLSFKYALQHYVDNMPGWLIKLPA